ncbi:MAG TPA: Hsp70 family protein, partial [Bacteroidales bacterium]|nr:Hsp70 family protein [Bacteroidales bacterium]
IPTKKTEVFSTASDNQSSVEIHVVQGEREFAKDNKTIGKFHLDGIPPAMKGVPQIEVTFDINANGIIEVSAKDKATNKSQQIRIEASSGLSEAEIERMKRDAEENAEADKKLRERIEKINVAESFISQTEKQLSENSDKISQDKKEKIDEIIKSLKEKIKNEDSDGIDKEMNKLQQLWNELSQDMYANKNTQGTEEQNKQTDYVDFEEILNNQK